MHGRHVCWQPPCLHLRECTRARPSDVVSNRICGRKRMTGMHGADGTDTTPLQWALACIRSRAFQLSPTLFAAVPFADLANHSPRPNSRLEPALEAPDAIRSGNSDNWVALVATEDIPAGTEVAVSYTGSTGATNRRLLVQYGFVIPDNENDRFDFELFEGYVSTTPLRGAPWGGGGGGGGGWAARCR